MGEKATDPPDWWNGMFEESTTPFQSYHKEVDQQLKK
jgi:hypothetical protein